MSRYQAAVLLTAVLCFPAVSLAGGSAKVSIAVKDAQLTEVVTALEEVAGRPVSVSPPLRATETVTIDDALTNLTVEETLNAILKPRGHNWVFAAQALESVGLLTRAHLVVEGVEPHSAADRAGLRNGDIILSVNGRTVDSRVDAARALALMEGGTSIRAMRREGTERRVFETRIQ